MKNSSTALRRLLRESVEVRATPKLSVEWEHNRYSAFASTDSPVTVTPGLVDDPEWLDIYSLESIAETARPLAGIAKSRFRANGSMDAAGQYRDVPTSSRYYLADVDDPYKYWSSQQKTSATLTSGAYNFSTPLRLTLMYAAPVVSNKVVVGFETSYARPRTYTLEVTYNGTTWVNAINSIAVPSDGLVAAWRQADGSWSATRSLLSPFAAKNSWPTLRGVRLTVNSMNVGNERLDVIQMGARLEADLSELVETYDRDFEISERSLIAPLGHTSSNTASVALNNMNGLFNNENANSPFAGLVGKRARFIMDLSYDATRFGGSSDERVREFTMWSDGWGSTEDLTSNAQLKDSSVLLQEAPVPKVFWGNLPRELANGQRNPAETDQQTVGAIIWQLLDILGFSNYAYERSDLDTGQAVPYFWPTEDATVWEQISELAEGTQTAVYFDEYDMLQIKTRSAMFDPAETVDWNLDSVTVGSKLPDIVETNNETDIVTNRVDINYKPAKFSEFANGFPKMETVWEPEEETLTLRASPLIRSLSKTGLDMWINYAEAAFWPYESMVNIRGEVIHYRGKEYMWTAPGNVVNYSLVYNEEDRLAIDAKSSVGLAWSNRFTGKLRVKQRGVGDTEALDHIIKPFGYTGMNSLWANNIHTPYATANSGMIYSNAGYVSIVPPKTQPGISYFYLAKHESTVDATNASYGARIRFPTTQINSQNYANGGIYFAGGDITGGLYLEILTSEAANVIKREINEVSLVYMPRTTPAKRIPGGSSNSNKGSTVDIVAGRWYEIDVRHVVQANGSAIVTAFVNGLAVGTWVVTAAMRSTWTQVNRFGLYVRSNSKMDVEYLYAMNNNYSKFMNYLDKPDDSTFLDLIRTGFASGYVSRDTRFGFFRKYLRTPRIRRRGRWVPGKAFTTVNSRAHLILDEFGPVIHEMREFNVSFDEAQVPVAHSRAMFTNTSQIDILEYQADAFGASFVLANASRANAVLKGQDTYTAGSENPIDQSFLIYGRKLIQEDEKSITKEDIASVRRNGTTATTFDNRFIQTDSAAEALGQWVLKMWSNGVDELSVEAFGNPLWQLGDLVTVNYPAKGMAPATHKYFVVGISNQYQEGLTTSLILRRAKS